MNKWDDLGGKPSICGNTHISLRLRGDISEVDRCDGDFLSACCEQNNVNDNELLFFFVHNFNHYMRIL